VWTLSICQISCKSCSQAQSPILPNPFLGSYYSPLEMRHREVQGSPEVTQLLPTAAEI
jgi:hypothetical protein